MTATFRFAPSPNGRLHLGHAYSALLNARLATAAQGRLLLRIEDIDPLRSKPDFAAAILTDLAWLGLVWEEPVRHQSAHLADYVAAADRLRAQGLLYRCDCSRGTIAATVAACEAESGQPWPRDPDGAPVYPGRCRDRRAETFAGPHAWRLDMRAALAAGNGPAIWRGWVPLGDIRAVESHPARWGDTVLVRKDVPTSYHLSVVVDDALQDVTHVVRGRDLEAATDLHRLLQDLLGLPSPLYHHHELLRDADGTKLAKSAGSWSLDDWRRQGATARDIVRWLRFDRGLG